MAVNAPTPASQKQDYFAGSTIPTSAGNTDTPSSKVRSLRYDDAVQALSLIHI